MYDLPEQNPKVAILILNYNGQKILSDCIISLKKTSYPNFEVYVIDNGSTDDSTACIEKNFQWVKLIKLDKNYGFCQAYNKASKIIHSEYLLFLNNDITTPFADWLAQMMNAGREEPNIGAVGAKLLFFSNLEIIENVGGTLHKWQGGTRLGFEEKDNGQYDQHYSVPFYVSGACLLIRRELFIRAGGFDSEMFAYSEDLDLCWRLRLMGYEIKFCPQAVLYHRLSASWKKSLKSLYLSHRNFIRASLKNYSLSNLLKNIPPLVVVSLCFGLFGTIQSRNKTFLLTMIKAVWHNVIHCRSTLKARIAVQSKRRVNDDTILKKLQKNYIENISAINRKLEVFA